MSEERDKRLVALAIERGLVTAEQIEACRQLQSQSPTQPPPSLLRVLLTQGYLTTQQVIGLAGSPHLPDLDRCELVKELGASTLGTTCVLRDPATGKLVTLKVLHRSLAGRREYVERLHRDVAVASKLESPHLARLLGSGDKFLDIFIVGDFVEGASLAELLRAKGRLEPHEVLSVGLAAAKALDVAHGRGLVHGAIAPSNLLVAQEGIVKLADLGLPRPPIEEISIARAGEGIRSPYYLSPEHLASRPQAEGYGLNPALPTGLDIRADLFSLGSVLYHSLTGQVPFRGDTTAEVTAAIREGQFRPFAEAAPSVSRAFAAVVEKLLQADPARRYQTPRELLDDLEALQAGRVPAAQRLAVAEAIAAKPKPPAAPAGAKGRRARLWLVAGAAVLALAAGTAALVGYSMRRRPAPPLPPGTESGTETEPAQLAKQGRAEIEEIVKAAGAPDGPKGAERLKGLQEAIERLKAAEARYKGTGAADEAKKRLIPIQAMALFEAAMAYAREHPDERVAMAKRLREVSDKYAETEAAHFAEQELAKIDAADRNKAKAEFEEAKKRAGDLEAKESFGDALAQYDALLKKGVSDEVKQLVLLEKNATLSKAERAFEAIDQQAQEKARGRYFEEAKALYARVIQSFGVEPFVGRARGRVAILQPLLESAATRRLAAIDTAKYQFFLSRLDASRQLAGSWELDAAAQEAEKLRPDLKTAGIENYLDAYLADLGLLRSLKLRAIQRLSDEGAPLFVKQFSLGKVAGKIDPHWLEAKALKADASEVVFQYGQVEVHRGWKQFGADDLYKLGKLACDPKDPQSHLLLAVHCLCAGLVETAKTELNAAKAGGQDVEAYLRVVELIKGPATGAVPTTKGEEASRLFMEAKRFMSEREWDRALHRLAILKTRYAAKDYGVSANLDEINQRIAECKTNVERLETETDLALGQPVKLLARKASSEWEQHFGKWSLDQGVLRGENTEDHDAEYLVSLHHAPSYELRVKLRVVSGTGAILRLAGKGRPNLGFWVHVTNPALVGLLLSAAADDKAADRVAQRYTFELGKDIELRAAVNPSLVEVGVVEAGGREAYVVRMPNKLAAEPAGVQTYGFVVPPKSVVEFRELSVRVLREQ